MRPGIYKIWFDDHSYVYIHLSRDISKDELIIIAQAEQIKKQRSWNIHDVQMLDNLAGDLLIGKNFTAFVSL